MMKVAAWSEEDVSDWLVREGMPEYVDDLARFDGAALLKLTADDFLKSPLVRVSSDGGRQLLERLETLRMETQMEAYKNGYANGHLPNGTAKTLQNGAPGARDPRLEMVQILIPSAERTCCALPTEWGKTGVAFMYAVVWMVSTTVVISVVHERVPPKEHTPPLPDKFFDLFDRVGWAFSICEINGLLLVALWFCQWLLLKHR